MARLRLLHWNKAEALKALAILRSSAHEVDYEEQFRPALMKEWRESPPEAFVIDLSRLPSHGREIAIAIRQSPKTRHVPLVFCGGDRDKVERTRALLPDATYCALPELAESLNRALAGPTRKSPARPKAMMDRYAGRSVTQKLGIKEGFKVLLVNSPRGFLKTLDDVPAGVEFVDEQDGQAAQVTLCFLCSVEDLQPVISGVRHLAAASKLWLLWRKKTAAGHAGVTEPLVRNTGLDLGLVDYKICSVDETWSAMAFARRR